MGVGITEVEAHVIGRACQHLRFGQGLTKYTEQLALLRCWRHQVAGVAMLYVSLAAYLLMVYDLSHFALSRQTTSWDMAFITGLKVSTLYNVRLWTSNEASVCSLFYSL